MIEDRMVERCVLAVLSEVFRNSEKQPPSLAPDTPIDSSFGLDSLDWAEVVVRLEEELGYDPFQVGAATELRTIGDLVRLYESTKPQGR